MQEALGKIPTVEVCKNVHTLTVRSHSSSASCTTPNPHFHSAQLDKKHERGEVWVVLVFSHLLESFLKTRILQSAQTEQHVSASSCSIEADAATGRAGLFRESSGINAALHDHKAINKFLKKGKKWLCQKLKWTGLCTTVKNSFWPRQ